jgi:hypothetical protein
LDTTFAADVLPTKFALLAVIYGCEAVISVPLTLPENVAAVELIVTPFAVSTVELAVNAVFTTIPFFTMKLYSVI